MTQTDAQPAIAKPILSPWEWLPAALLPVLAFVHLYAAAPGGLLSRFALFVGLGLIPGTLWRFAGKSSWNIHRLFFALGLVAFVLENPNLRPDRASWTRIRENLPLVVLGFALSFTQTLWGTLRTQRLLTDSGVAIGMYDAFTLCLTGSFFNIFLPGSNGGDAYRVYVLTRRFGAKLSAAIASITLDRLLGLPSLIFVLLPGMLLDYGFLRSHSLLSGLIPFIAGAAVLCLVLVCYLASAGKSRRENGNGNDPAPREKTGWLRRSHDMVAANVTRRATLPLALFHGFLSHCACIAACLCFGLALGVEGVPPLRYFLLVPLAMTINAIPGAPGGLGQGELAMATLLDMAAPGMGNAQAGVVIMLLLRLSTMAMGLLGGAHYALGRRGARNGGADAWR